ncbi:transposase, MuDR, MULE transposase domain protein [Tanacetum coccineum]|uniref:Transposase, MuDR, MULE transposase domain protein n=1 Tax=Tanacetum coccineum TaxID=301880 RepID=A0ABQ5AAF6_9ASTR
MDLNIDISYKQAWRSKNVALESISGCPKSSFAQLPYYCYNLERTNDSTVTHIETDDEDRFKMVFIAFGVVIRSFKNHMRHLIIIDATHLKGRYEGTNQLAVGMDGNNQIIPITTGVSQGETGPSWTWFLSKLTECIGEIPDLTIISDRHAAILSSCGAVFPNAFHGYCCRHLMMNCKLKSIKMQCLFWKMCKAYLVDDFRMAINELEAKRPDVYQRLIEAGVEMWSRAYCTHDRYNYMTSNSAESINNLTRDVREVPITNLMEWYRQLVQNGIVDVGKNIKVHGPLDELSPWATAKMRKKMQKSINWVVVGIETGKVYEVDDHRRVETVELCNGTCTCRKWQVSGLPCGHVLAICRVYGLTDCNGLAKRWFMRTALKGTYQELVYPVGEVSSWQIPNNLPVVKPPVMSKPAGRPKSTKRIRSQGEEPVTVRCGRCGARGHNRQGCRESIAYTKERTYPRGSSQQAEDYFHQSMPWETVNLDDP